MHLLQKRVIGTLDVAFKKRFFALSQNNADGEVSVNEQGGPLPSKGAQRKHKQFRRKQNIS